MKLFEQFNQAIQMDSTLAEAYYQRSRVYLAKQMFAEAITDSNFAINLQSGRSTALQYPRQWLTPTSKASTRRSST